MLAERNVAPCPDEGTSAPDHVKNGTSLIDVQDQDRLHNKENVSIDLTVLSLHCNDIQQDDIKRPGRQSCSSIPEDATAATAESSVSSGEHFKTLDRQKSILRTESRISDPVDRPASYERKRRVGFSTVLVRDYSIILGDHPCVSYGPPLTIDWEYHQHEPRDVDEYEFDVALTRRSLKEMMLNYYQRKYLLADHSEAEFKAVKREINRIKSRRDVTKKLRYLMKAEVAIESACRKMKRKMKSMMK